MKRHKQSAIAILAAFGLLGLVTPATAADETGTKASDGETATAPIPAWRSFGSSGDEEDLEETFFRLAQDFVSTSEIGVRRLGSVPIWPRGELKMGPVRVLPYFRQSAEWESNVNRRPATGSSNLGNDDGRDSGWNFVSNPGLLADTLLMGGRMRIALSMDARWNERTEDDLGDDFELDSQLGVSYHWPNGAWVSVGYAYERRSEPVEVEFTEDFQRTNNRVFWNLGFDRDIFFGSKAQLDVGMSMRDVNPNENGQYESVDRTETETYVRVSYPFWKDSTRLFVRGRYKKYSKESPGLADGDQWSMDFGMDGSIPILEGDQRGLRGTVSVGFDTSDYAGSDTRVDASTGRTRANDNDDGETSLSFRAGLQDVISPRQTLALRAQRQQQFSAYSNYQINDRIDLTYTRTLMPRLVVRAAVFLEHTDPSGENPNYVNTAPGTTGNGQSPNRHTSRGGVGLGGRYTLNEWADADVSWDYDRRNGDPDRRYTNHRIVFGITIYLNALRPDTRRSRMLQTP